MGNKRINEKRTKDFWALPKLCEATDIIKIVCDSGICAEGLTAALLILNVEKERIRTRNK